MMVVEVGESVVLFATGIELVSLAKLGSKGAEVEGGRCGWGWGNWFWDWFGFCWWSNLIRLSVLLGIITLVLIIVVITMMTIKAIEGQKNKNLLQTHYLWLDCD